MVWSLTHHSLSNTEVGSSKHNSKWLYFECQQKSKYLLHSIQVWRTIRKWTKLWKDSSPWSLCTVASWRRMDWYVWYDKNTYILHCNTHKTLFSYTILYTVLFFPISICIYQFINFLLTHTRIFRESGAAEGNILVDHYNNSSSSSSSSPLSSMIGGGTNNGAGISDFPLNLESPPSKHSTSYHGQYKILNFFSIVIIIVTLFFDCKIVSRTFAHILSHN